MELRILYSVYFCLDETKPFRPITQISMMDRGLKGRLDFVNDEFNTRSRSP